MPIDKYNKDVTPKILPVLQENVPAELKALNQWCLWDYWWSGKKWTKPPRNQHGQKQDHKTVGLTFDQALHVHQQSNCKYGIGFSISADDPICGLDFDNVLDADGKLLDEHRPLFENIPATVIEVSPSGQGLRALGLGNFDNINTRVGSVVEAYSSDRYLTITGRANGTAGNALQDLTEYVESIRPSSKTPPKKPAQTPDYDITLTPSYNIVAQHLPFMVSERDNYQDWLDVGMILHNEFRGATAALELWTEWSSASPQFLSTEDCAYKWESFGKKPEADQLTIRTFYEKIKPYITVALKANIGKERLHVKDLTKRKPKPKIYAVNDLFREKSFNMIHAGRGLGKTNFALSLAMAIAAGKPFLKWQIPKARRVLYIDGEMGEEGVEDRVILNMISTGITVTGNNFDIITQDLLPNEVMYDLASLEGQTWLQGHIADFNPDVIFIDSLMVCFRGMTESQDAWEKVQPWFVKMRSQGMCVNLIHHDNKAGSAQSGFSNKEMSMDTVIHLTQAGGQEKEDGMRMDVTFSKHRSLFGEQIKTFNCGFETVSNANGMPVSKWFWSYENEELEGGIAGMLIANTETIASIAEANEVATKTINRYKKKMVEAGVVFPKRGTPAKVPPGYKHDT